MTLRALEPSCSSNSMSILFDAPWEIPVHNIAQSTTVEPSGCNISACYKLSLPTLKVSKRPLTLLLVHVSMESHAFLGYFLLKESMHEQRCFDSVAEDHHAALCSQVTISSINFTKKFQ